MSIYLYNMNVYPKIYRTSIQIYKHTAMSLKAFARSENETYDMIINRLLGDRKISKDYIFLYRPNHPNAYPSGYIAEHRYIMSKHLKRPLKPGEMVHHQDGNKKNNNIKNLLITSHEEHIIIHDFPGAKAGRIIPKETKNKHP